MPAAIRVVRHFNRLCGRIEYFILLEFIVEFLMSLEFCTDAGAKGPGNGYGPKVDAPENSALSTGIDLRIVSLVVIPGDQVPAAQAKAEVTKTFYLTQVITERYFPKFYERSVIYP